MRVYVLSVFAVLFSLVSLAIENDDQEVKLVGDKNYTNNAILVYDGIDVSNYQNDIDWSTTAKDPNIKYVYIKATEGATHRQHRYRKNIENARRHKVLVGSYHFLTTTAPIESQFNNFISVAKPEEQDLLPLLDVEKRDGWTIKQLQDSVMKFAKLLEDYYGCKPMIYANSTYFNNYLGAQFASYPLFIARYAKSEPQLNYGARWILWQFSDRGRIDGIDALVDLSRFNSGCSVRDITYKRSKKKVRASNGEVPRPKVRHQEKPEVPMSPKQRREMENRQPPEKTEAQKRGEEAQRKKEKMEEKKRKEEAKKAEEQRKEEEKKRKEDEKKRKELEKRQKELEKKQKEQEKKQKEEEAKRKARMQAQERMKAEKDNAANIEKQRQQQQDQQRRAELEQAKNERLQKQKAEEQKQAASQNQNTTTTTGKNKPKATNQSSADNDEIRYNTKTNWKENVRNKSNTNP